MRETEIDCLLSLPVAGVAGFRPWSVAAAHYFVTSDPPASQLGSGGGTAHILQQAWAQAAAAGAFGDWLAASRKLIIHGSGQSRRLPAYAAEGKPLLPIPLLAGLAGQAPEQRLVDLQRESYQRILRHAPDSYRVMVTCGDVLLINDSFMPEFPEADVLIVGMNSTPDEGSRHGVMFCPDGDDRLDFFLQKPSPEKTRSLAESHRFYLDTGVWLLTAKALTTLLRKCGWDEAGETFHQGIPDTYELFDKFGLALGMHPVAADAEIGELRAAVLPLPAGRFFHFGTSRSIISSTMALAKLGERSCLAGAAAAPRDDHCIFLNAEVGVALNGGNRQLWIENAIVPPSWSLRDRHVITGIPPNEWSIDLPAGVCVAGHAVEHRAEICLRVYGFDDPFKGRLDDPATIWMERSVSEWLVHRNLDFALAGLAPAADIQAAALFPLIDAKDPDAGPLLAWMVAHDPPVNPHLRQRWLRSVRLSAADLLQQTNVAAAAHERTMRVNSELNQMAPAIWQITCAQLDLEALARRLTNDGLTTPPPLDEHAKKGYEMALVHDVALRERLGEKSSGSTAARLRSLLVNRMAIKPVAPRRAVGHDQIVWGRAPARIDFAGGWTDTPPYCLEHGGKVVNVALTLNGQPPIQAFARICNEPHLVIRSIDLGLGEVITTFDDLLAAERLGGGFGIARAAFRLAGLDPDFNASSRHLPLDRFLMEIFGGGIELSMLAAIPKGSGLGTSSILAATLLGTLGNLMGHNWGEQDLFVRTLALEQILTSGGGWQDQVGGILGGLKLVESTPGLSQKPVAHWLPAQLLELAIADRRFQLYYTGITRVAHNILGEIVSGLFLNDATRLRVIDEIGHNADFAAGALQRQDWHCFTEAVSRSWRLNQQLDSGTNPPAVAKIIAQIAPWLAAMKLAGAGGGGYMALLSHTAADGLRLRQELERNPPNERARFVDVAVSHSGLEITRS